MAYLSETHDATTKLVEAYLHAMFERATTSSHDIHPAYERLWRTIHAVAFAGGKRIRPYLTALGYQLGPDRAVDITPVAAAQELLHIATLMHDDVIDRDTVRHGKPNMNGVYEAIYAPFTDKTQKVHYARSAGILAGDLLFSAAHRAIITSDFNESDKRCALDMLELSIFEVIGGELLDIEASFVTDTSYNPLTIAEYKTAAYTITGPLLTGAKLSHATAATIDHLTAYSRAIGVAFQIQDDLLGLFGDESVTGKSTVGDIREGKHTYIIEQFKTTASPADLELFAHVFGKTTAPTEAIEHLKSAIKQSPAYTTTLAAIDTYVAEAVGALESFDDTPSKHELLALTEHLSRRTY